MRHYLRIITTSVLLSFLFLIIISVFYYLAFPIENWQLVWTIRIFDIPFVLMLPLITLLFGLILGMVVVSLWQKRIQFVESSLSSVLKNQSFTEPVSYEEMKQILEKLKEVQQYIQEQTKRTQKLIEERASEQEETINKVISEERNRLARELHDSVSQELFAASMLASAVMAADNNHQDAKTTKQLQQIEAIIQQAQLEMRALLLHLRPILLKDKSLKEGMEQLLEELHEKIPMSIQWRLEDIQVNKGIEDHLFRILQEAISNGLRHANANQLDIVLIKRDNMVILRVEDNGVGFDVEKEKSSSYGLTNMYERAAEIGARLHIVSIPDQGTKIEVRVPLLKEGEEDI